MRNNPSQEQENRQPLYKKGVLLNSSPADKAIEKGSMYFVKEMNNIINYSIGFLEGVQKGKSLFMNALGEEVIGVLKNYIDSSARVNPAMLKHMYEWNRVGSPSARLFDINYTVSGLGLSIKSTFRQSSTIKSGSKVPFYNKAKIMESGTPVRIAPKNSGVLSFEVNGERVFTKKPVVVDNPGGDVAGKYQEAFDSFFNMYFSQAFLRSSGLQDYLENPLVYKKNLTAGSKQGKAKGVDVGYRWIINAGVVA
jgi:hypothetical protein